MPDKTSPAPKIIESGWPYFTNDEAVTVEAPGGRLIPPDPETPGGKYAGCAIFIDRQLAGPYGHFKGLYTAGPFHDGSEQQGPQSPLNPADELATEGLDVVAVERGPWATRQPIFRHPTRPTLSATTSPAFARAPLVQWHHFARTPPLSQLIAPVTAALC